MKHKILNIMALISLVGASLFVTVAPVSAAADTCPGGNTAKGQVLQGVGQTGSECDDSGVNKTMKTVVNILSYFAGVIAVIMIIIAGFKYITSSGDAGKVGSAKTTLIYAMVGLAIVALSQFLVHFVLTQATP